MSDERDNGGPAFRGSTTLRDWFAGMALQGMLAADASYSGPRWSAVGTGEDYQRGGGKWADPSGVAEQAYEIADAMLRARKASAK